jgi:hypothetical protein
MVVDLPYLVGHEAQHRRDRAALLEGGQAQPADAAGLDAEIELMLAAQLIEPVGRHDLGQQGHDGTLVHALLVDRDQVAVDLDLYRRVHRQEQVGCALVPHQLEQTFHGHHRLLLSACMVGKPAARAASDPCAGNVLTRRAAVR